MKKLSYTVLSLLAMFSFITFQSCKEDKTPPEISVIGSTDTIIPVGTPYTDPGATATDDKDDAVYVISDYRANNPDINVPNIYTITYKAQDRNANSSVATRKVSVTWVGSLLAFTYSVNSDTLAYVDTLQYSSTVILDPINMYHIYASNLWNYFTGNTSIYLKGNTITIPSQFPDGPFTQYSISGSGIITYVSPNINWDLHYDIKDTTTGVPVKHRHAAFIY